MDLKYLTEIYSASDLLVVPSLVEAFGQVALEAASCNLPTVAFNDTGLSEIIVIKKMDICLLQRCSRFKRYKCLNNKNYNLISNKLNHSQK